MKDNQTTALTQLQGAKCALNDYETTLAALQKAGGAIVRQMRDEMGLTQHAFAALVKINQSHLSRLENNKTPLTRWMLERLIAKIL